MGCQRLGLATVRVRAWSCRGASMASDLRSGVEGDHREARAAKARRSATGMPSVEGGA
jgi:hypothetical protein